MSIANCPDNLPDLENTLRQVADTWAASTLRPRVEDSVRTAWQKLINDWVEARDVPIFVRKHQNNRGARLNHETGRVIVPADNGPAHWAIRLALDGICPTLKEVRNFVAEGSIPVAMVVKRVERALFSFQPSLQSTAVNKSRWKVCHIEQVKLGTRQPLESAPMKLLENHFRRFLSPANMLWSHLNTPASASCQRCFKCRRCRIYV